MSNLDYEIVFFCPECGAELEAAADLCGHKIACVSCGKEVSVPIPGLNEGLEIGEFVLCRKLGSGGMGEVWLAEQQSMHRRVALKILHPHLAEDQGFVRRFMAETQNAGRLQHPNIITAYAAGSIGNYYFLATSYVDGVELADRLKIDGSLPEREALRIVRDIARALKHAWEEHRMLHRDVKPSNIILDKHDVPYLMDMGIAAIVSDDNTLQTREHMVVGTPDYISPEQAKNLLDLDFRSDVYSLGATLYHLVAGSPPFQADTFKELLKMHVVTPLPEPQNANRRVSPQCAALLKIMMAKEREQRQSSWSYVVADIDAVLAGRFPAEIAARGQPDRKQSVAEIKYSAPDAQVHLPVGKTRRHGSSAIAARTDAAPDTGVTLRLSGQEPMSTVAIKPTNPDASSSQPVPKPDEPQPCPSKVPPPRVFDAGKKRRRWLGCLIFLLFLSLLLGIALFVLHRFEILNF